MTKRISMAMALVLAAASSVSAQSIASSQADVLLTVERGLSITTPGNTQLDFGTVVAGAGALSVAAATDAAAVEFEIAGEPSKPITITSTLWAADGTTANAISEPGGATIAFTSDLIYTTDTATQGGAAIAGTEALSATGGGSVWMGGSMSVPNGQTGGLYSGTLTLTVNY